MSWPQTIALVVAGVGAGLAGSMAGLASLVSFPALLAIGLPPVAANVTNTVALVGSGIGAVAGSRPELSGQGRRIRALLPAAALGGLVGAGLLLLGPAAAFEAVVPYLVGGASIVLLLGDPIARLRSGRRAGRRSRDSDPGGGRAGSGHARRAHPGRGLAPGVGLVSVYGGYFGAGAGVVVLALLSAVFPTESPHRLNAVKNVLLGLSNAVAAVVFAISGPVVWLAALPLALGFVAGARVGPVLLRRVPRRLFRIGIGLAGLGLAVQLWLTARH